jgi:hypothetical protein
VSEMVNREHTVALVHSLLRVLDQDGPRRADRRRRWPCRCHRRTTTVHRQHHRTTLDLEWFHHTGGDPGAESSRQPPPTLIETTNPRVRVLERPPVSLPRPTGLLADGTLRSSHLFERTSGTAMRHPWLRSMPLLVTSRHLRFSSPRQGEGGEGNAEEVDEEEDPIEIFLVLESPPRDWDQDSPQESRSVNKGSPWEP